MTDWASLSPADQATLLYCSNPTIGVGAELVAFADLSTVRDLSGSVQIDSGDVDWDGSAVVHRDVQVTLSEELAWGTALVRIFRTVTDPVSGLSARRNRGVFCLTSPEQDMGRVMVGADGSRRLIYSVTGQDRSSLLDRQPGYSVWIPRTDVGGDPVSVYDALVSAYTQAGVPCYLIDSSSTLTALPTDMTWPMLPIADDTSSTDSQQSSSGDPEIASNASSGDGATWRQIINDLHSLVSYRAVWADGDGYLRSTPYADPATRPVLWTVNTDRAVVTWSGATIPVLSVVGMDRSVAVDPWGVPNRWIFVWSNMPDSGGGPPTPTSGNGGVYVVDNVDEGASSQSQRNGLVYASTFNFTAASAADLIAQGDAKVASDKRVVSTYTLKLRQTFVMALGHFDVVALSGPEITGGGAKVQITHWTEAFGNDLISVTAESV